MPKNVFELYPAIDLRGGQVVRLRTGDPGQQTVYNNDPADAAKRWLSSGAGWLHVVNLDGAFGEADNANQAALEAVVRTAQTLGAQVQFGGGLRSLAALKTVFELGVSRAILGTVLVEQPDLLPAALQIWGADKIAAGIDARDGEVRVRGWQEGSAVNAKELAVKLAGQGLCWIIFTDISRDGTGFGANLNETAELAQESGLQVIASGGFSQLPEVLSAKQLGLSGAILGRSLYEGKIDLKEAVQALKGSGYAG